jgi:DNA-binding transcriptional LysR family regulator
LFENPYISKYLFSMKNNVSPDDLSVFLAVVREGGFRAAAKRIGVAPSKVSSVVSRIEAQLGLPLLMRTTRSIMVTDEGRRLAERVAPLLTDIEAACGEVSSAADRVQGRLKLNVPGAVMPDILLPLITAFVERHPAVEVEIVVDNEPVDILAAGCETGIRYGSLSIPIGPRRQQVALAASPSYLAKHGEPSTPANLSNHHAIRHRLPSEPLLPWMLERGGSAVRVEPETRLTARKDQRRARPAVLRGTVSTDCCRERLSDDAMPSRPRFRIGG